MLNTFVSSYLTLNNGLSNVKKEVLFYISNTKYGPFVLGFSLIYHI
jgi:hypothetical protein